MVVVLMLVLSCLLRSDGFSLSFSNVSRLLPGSGPGVEDVYAHSIHPPSLTIAAQGRVSYSVGSLFSRWGLYKICGSTS